MKNIQVILAIIIFSASGVYGNTIVETFDYTDINEFKTAGNWTEITSNVSTHQSEITAQGDLKLHHIQPASSSGGYSVGYTKTLPNPTQDFSLNIELIQSSTVGSTADTFIQLYGSGNMVFYLGVADWKTYTNQAIFFLYDQNYSLFRSDPAFGYFTSNPKEVTINFERIADSLTVAVYRGIGAAKTLMLDVDLASYIGASESMDVDVEEIRLLFGGTAASANLNTDFGQFNYMEMQYDGTEMVPEPFSIILLLMGIIGIAAKNKK